MSSLSSSIGLDRGRLVILAALAAIQVWPLSAAEFPEKPVRFVVGFTPGGPSDIVARLLGRTHDPAGTPGMLCSA